MRFDRIIKLCLAVAALLAAGTYAYNSLTDRADPAFANGGVDGREGFVVSTMANKYIIVTKYSANPFRSGEMLHTLSIYELKKQGADGEAKLYLVGSRVIEYDSGPSLVKFPEIKNETPNDLKKAIEKAARGKRRN